MQLLNLWLSGMADHAHASEWISGISGAGGAVLGSLTAIIATEAFNARRHRRDQSERMAAAAFSAYQRLNQIYSVSMIIRDHLREGAKFQKDMNAYLCMVTRPIQRMSPPVIFPIEELWAITKIGGPKMINSINSLDGVFNTLLDSLDGYNVRRKELTDRMPAPADMQKDHGTSELSQEEVKALRPIMADLDGRLEALLPMSESLVSDSFDAIFNVATAEAKPLGKKFEIQIPDPNGQLVKFGAGSKSPIPVPGGKNGGLR